MTVGELIDKLKRYQSWASVSIEGSGPVVEITDVYEDGFRNKDRIGIVLWSEEEND